MNESEGDIYTAIYDRLKSLTPSWNLKKLGVDFQPGAGAYMRMTMLDTPRPEFAGFGNGRFTRNTRLVQVDVFYPKQEKRTDMITAQAEAVRALFWPTPHGLSIPAGAGAIHIDEEPTIGPLIEGGASHLQIPVTVVFSTDRGPAG